ncbi:4Fe-4S dicluster domain-containing protein [Eggerthellaceae bacterium zg-1084]|uniref:4Fe-4S dicluster domain-containing protein n=1 Tax=Berryella wangjianweii TaxID=2734634 RepID=UPI001551BDB5|nr:4Fe-4S dicluster domain-containing protein [Berryella wangjianweii]NPD30919.1 4Fe-4S dicluster domain-containing protein [Berryella wangjianweii]
MAESKENVAPQGFYFDQVACVGCRTCQIACKDKNDLKVGRLFRKVETYETGEFPHPATFHYSGACNHCRMPACVDVCPSGATFVNEDDGTVQHDDEKCIGCEYCVKACPYHHPVLMEELNVVHRCDACIELRNQGEKPACVASCPMRALDFGPLDSLRLARPDAVSQISVLPDSSQTDPSVVIEARPAALEGEPRRMVM